VIDFQEAILRGLAGAVAAGVVTGTARTRGMLSPGGQGVAFAIGVAATAAGWTWAALLIAFFVSSSALTIWRADDKMRRTINTIPQVAERSALQVAANGALFALFLALNFRSPNPRWEFAALGALAAANADTWATEIGIMLGGTPRSIFTWRRVPLGMSGGVTVLGTLAGASGALFIAVLAAWLMPSLNTRTLMIVAAAGTAGMLGDSLAGATLQTRRYCDRCRQWTERRVHPCGYRTTHRRGFKWMTNDEVNLIGTFTGALTAMVLMRLLRG
jgi:uncharacterized protein (TIGR00297 family)